MNSNFYIKNRQKLFNNINECSIAVLFSGEALVKVGDENYPFTPNRNFYYLSGISEENVILTISKYESVIVTKLYIKRADPVLAKWIGTSVSKEKAEEISGIEVNEIKYIDEFEDEFSKQVFKNGVKNIYLDLENRKMNSNCNKGVQFAKKLREEYPYLRIENVCEIMSSLRVIKEECEINAIKKAIAITKVGIEKIMKCSKPGMKEYELEAEFDYVLAKNGIKDKSFKTIMATGKNATILHYVDNNALALDKDLILFDLGAQVEYYNADISRTIPVDGKFNSEQKVLYNIVLEGQRRVIEAIKPGVPFRKLNEILIDYYFEKLKELGLCDTKEDVGKFYFHNVSHFLGLETHDVGSYGEKLKENMVLTVEPGLYFEQKGIGIRIEDDLLVTKDGSENLSKDIIKTIDDIENYMAKGADNG